LKVISFGIGTPNMVRGDHTVDDLVIVLYTGITANNALFKASAGTNADASPQYALLYASPLSKIAIWSNNRRSLNIYPLFYPASATDYCWSHYFG